MVPLELMRSRFTAARTVLTDAVAAHAFPGAAFGVLLRGTVIEHGAVGRFTYDADAPEVLPSTVFDLASVTKVVATTAVAMLLHQRGSLDLETLLGDVLAGFVVGHARGDGKEKVTLRMLLAHSSGLPAYARLYQSYTTPCALLRACLQLPLESRPMQRADYSDIGFILLGKALEVITGEPLADLCRREVFAPLGLSNTRFCPPPGMARSIPPTSIDSLLRHRTLQGEVQDEHAFILGGASGHAGLFSNVPDLLSFAREILQSKRDKPALDSTAPKLGHGYSSFFSPETVELFASRQTEPAGTTRALGWDTPSNPSSSGRHFGPRSIGHLGYAGTSLWIDRDRNLAVALLTNRTWPDCSNDAIRAVRPAFHDAILDSLDT